MTETRDNVTTITCDRWKAGDGKSCDRYISPAQKETAGFCNLPDRFKCIEALKHFGFTLSQSSAKTFAQCHYKFYLNKVMGIRPHDHMLPAPIKLGGTWDKFIESWASGGAKSFSLKPFIEKYRLWNSDVAKLKALMKAFVTLDFQVIGPDPVTQQPTLTDMGNLVITGFVDIGFSGHMQEYKLSGRPDYLTKLESIHMQCGTYLLANPRWEYVDMMVTRVPQLQTGTGRMTDESDEAFEKRVYDDIMKRPGYYFIGYRKKDRVFGKRFWRSEFDFDTIEKTYLAIKKEIQLCFDNDFWYKNELSCHVPTNCWFLAHKKSGVFSEEIYKQQDKP